MQRFLGESSCRRKVVDEYFDGALGRVGCREGEEGCDTCRITEEPVIREREEEESIESRRANTKKIEIQQQNDQRKALGIRKTRQVQEEAKEFLGIIPSLIE